MNDGIDFIKVRFRVPIPGASRTIINNYYRNNPTTFVEFMSNEEIQKSEQENQISESDKYGYLMDTSITDFERFVRYINDSEGCQFITVNELTRLLEDKI